MQNHSDAQLLRQYAAQRSEAAFSEIVARHAGLVYSAALRQLDSPDLARDVAQSVFTDLARKAPSLADKLSGDASLAGWLYRSTRFAARDRMRGDRRRQARERQVMEHFDATAESAPQWEQVRPVLDEAMAELSEEDREAVLLRYFEKQDLHAVGQALGVSDDAAQKRVSRALERLHTGLTSRGVTTTAGALSGLLAVETVSFAPAGLAATLSATALAGTTLTTAATATATKAIAMTTLQKTLIAATLAAAVGTGIYEARLASTLQTRVQTLEQQQAPLAEQGQQLTKDRDDALRQLAALRNENERLNRNTAELLRLRGENTRLKADAQELAKLKASFSSDGPAAESWLARVNLLKQRLEQTPEARIPELRYLNEYDWLNAARSDLKTDNDYRRALSSLRTSGEGKFATRASEALKKYLQENNQQFPTQLSQLLPYFSVYFQPPVDDAILQRWEIVPTTNGIVAFGGNMVITQKAPVDDEYDSRYGIGPAGSGHQGSGSFKMPQVKEVVANTNLVKAVNIDPRDATAVYSALKAFSAANGGQQVTNASQLLPYLTTPEQQAALLRLSGEMGVVGVALTQGDNNLPRIQRVLPASAAEKAGVKAGALLLSIDGIGTAGKSMAEWTGMIRGKVGTTVTLEVADPTTSRTNRFTLTRAKM